MSSNYRKITILLHFKIVRQWKDDTGHCAYEGKMGDRARISGKMRRSESNSQITHHCFHAGCGVNALSGFKDRANSICATHL